jgi:hypothetical protein
MEDLKKELEITKLKSEIGKIQEEKQKIASERKIISNVLRQPQFWAAAASIIAVAFTFYALRESDFFKLKTQEIELEKKILTFEKLKLDSEKINLTNSIKLLSIQDSTLRAEKKILEQSKDSLETYISLSVSDKESKIRELIIARQKLASDTSQFNKTLKRLREECEYDKKMLDYRLQGEMINFESFRIRLEAELKECQTKK